MTATTLPRRRRRRPALNMLIGSAALAAAVIAPSTAPAAAMTPDSRTAAADSLRAAADPVLAWNAPASAGTTQIGGDGVFDNTGTCPEDPPSGFESYDDYPPILLTGGLEGCWYTDVLTSQDLGAPSGVYLETGREVFVGSLNDGPVGTFTTTYRFESRWDPDVSSGVELKGRCQHPIVAGSGIGGFAGATGRVDFKDIVADGTYVYRGHLKLP